MDKGTHIALKKEDTLAKTRLSNLARVGVDINARTLSVIRACAPLKRSKEQASLALTNIPPWCSGAISTYRYLATTDRRTSSWWLLLLAAPLYPLHGYFRRRPEACSMAASWT